MWLGQGAGGEATATAVLGDLLDAARNRFSGRHDIPFSVDRTLHSVEGRELESVFYISIDVLDRPGVLAAVASIFGENGVSIQSMSSRLRGRGPTLVPHPYGADRQRQRHHEGPREARVGGLDRCVPARDRRWSRMIGWKACCSSTRSGSTSTAWMRS